jgi:hypothetical protein
MSWARRPGAGCDRVSAHASPTLLDTPQACLTMLLSIHPRTHLISFSRWRSLSRWSSRSLSLSRSLSASLPLAALLTPPNVAAALGTILPPALRLDEPGCAPAFPSPLLCGLRFIGARGPNCEGLSTCSPPSPEPACSTGSSFPPHSALFLLPIDAASSPAAIITTPLGPLLEYARACCSNPSFSYPPSARCPCACASPSPSSPLSVRGGEGCGRP